MSPGTVCPRAHRWPEQRPKCDSSSGRHWGLTRCLVYICQTPTTLNLTQSYSSHGEREQRGPTLTGHTTTERRWHRQCSLRVLGLSVSAWQHRSPEESTSSHFNSALKCPARAPAKFASAGGKFFLITVSREITAREGFSEMKNTNDWGEKHSLSNPEKISPKFTFSTISQPKSNTKKLWNSTHIYEGLVQKSTAFVVSVHGWSCQYHLTHIQVTISTFMLPLLGVILKNDQS